MILLGLTGSIRMGKTTTAAMFAAEGAPVYDADAAVHALYAPGGGAAEPLAAVFPEAVTSQGGVDRAALSRRIERDPSMLKTLEAIVHPLLASHRSAFLAAAQAAGRPLAVLDIPLLFETGAERSVDAVVVVTAPAQVQAERVLARPGMDTAKFAALLARQTPDTEKRARADFVIDTSRGLDAARADVRAVLAKVRAPGWTPTAS